MPNFLRSTFAVLSVILSASAMQAQDAPLLWPEQTAKTLEVKVGVDSSVIRMQPETARYLNMIDSLDRVTKKSMGFRIQIYSSSGPSARKDALDKESEFLKLYTDGRSYTQWNYPNWVVRLGDFRTHLEALEFHHEIRQIFPASFIVKDEINVKE